MARLSARLEKLWFDLNIERTPGIYVVITLLGGFVFSVVALGFSALAFIGVGQVLGAPLPDSTAGVICVPPLIILASWLVYRARWFRVFFSAPKRS